MIHISFGDLWTYHPSAPDVRLPVSEMPTASDHVHGSLTFEVRGRQLPYLGYFGPDDVCLTEWAGVLHRLRSKLSSSDPAEFTYDEGEESQPAFHFRREGPQVFISIAASEISGTAAHPDWQRVPCALSELLAQVDGFERALRSQLATTTGSFADQWWSRHVEHAA